MTPLKTEVSDVIYNAASQAFEAKVTVHDAEGASSYPCAIHAPLDMSFERAAAGLAKQALRKHGKPTALRSFVARLPSAASLRVVHQKQRRGLPVGQYGFFRGRAA